MGCARRRRGRSGRGILGFTTVGYRVEKLARAGLQLPTPMQSQTKSAAVADCGRRPRSARPTRGTGAAWLRAPRHAGEGRRKAPLSQHAAASPKIHADLDDERRMCGKKKSRGEVGGERGRGGVPGTGTFVYSVARGSPRRRARGT